MSKHDNFVKSFVDSLVKEGSWKDWAIPAGAGIAGAGLGGLGTYLVQDYYEDIEDEEQNKILDTYIDAAQDTLGGLQSEYGSKLQELKSLAEEAQSSSFQRGVQEGIQRAIQEGNFKGV